jgi:hypothetical protein
MEERVFDAANEVLVVARDGVFEGDAIVLSALRPGSKVHIRGRVVVAEKNRLKIIELSADIVQPLRIKTESIQVGGVS